MKLGHLHDGGHGMWCGCWGFGQYGGRGETRMLLVSTSRRPQSFQPELCCTWKFCQLVISSEISHDAVSLGHLYGPSCAVGVIAGVLVGRVLSLLCLSPK